MGTPSSQRTKMGLICVYGCLHTEVYAHYHNHGWVPTPNVHWHTVWNVIKAVRDALAHEVWPRGITAMSINSLEQKTPALLVDVW